MDSENFDQFRHIIRNSENIINSSENTEYNLIYTFSSLDLNEFENYLKELPSRRSVITPFRQSTTSGKTPSLLFPRKSYVFDTYENAMTFTQIQKPKIQNNAAFLNKIFIQKPKFQVNLKQYRENANKNEYIRFPNKKEFKDNNKNQSFSDIKSGPHDIAHLSDSKLITKPFNQSFNPYLNVNPIKIYPSREKFKSFHESNQPKINKPSKEEIDLILHYTQILKEKNSEVPQPQAFQSLEQKIFQIKLEQDAKHHGLFEFTGIMKKKKKQRNIKEPKKIMQVILQKVVNDINLYDQLILSYHNNQKYEITSQKIKSTFLETTNTKRHNPNTKLLKQDLFIFNLLLNIQKKGLSNMNPKEIEILESIVYERKQQIKSMVIQYLPLPMTSEFIPIINKNEKSEIKNLPNINLINPRREFLKKKAVSSESKRTSKIDYNKHKNSTSGLKIYFSFTNTKPVSSGFSSQIPKETYRKQTPNLSEIPKNEIIEIHDIFEKNEIEELTQYKNRTSSRKKKFSGIRKISSCRDLKFSSEFDDLNAISNENNNMYSPNKQNDVNILDNIKKSLLKRSLSSDDILHLEGESDNLIKAQRESIIQKNKENENERRDFRTWSKFLRKSIEFTQQNPEVVQKYDFSNVQEYDERVKKIEELLKNFFNNKNVKEVMEATRVKTSMTDTNSREKPPKKIAKKMEKKQIKLINQNSLIKTIFSKKLKETKKHEKDSDLNSFSRDHTKNIIDQSFHSENLDNKLNTSSNFSKIDNNNSNILDKDISQLFDDIKQKTEDPVTVRATSKIPILPLKATTQNLLKHPFLKSKNETLPKMTSPTQKKPAILAIKKRVASFSVATIKKTAKKTKQSSFKKKHNKKTKGAFDLKILPDVQDDIKINITEPDIQIELNKAEVKSLDEYLMNEVLSEYPEFFNNLENENINRMGVEDMKNLRNWAYKRKRRSYIEPRDNTPLARKGSFQVLEENREEIKLLKAFRINLKNEHKKRKEIENNENDNDNEINERNNNNNVNDYLKNKKKNEMMKRFFELNLKEMKEDVDKKIQIFIKNKKLKMSAALKSNIDKYNRMKVLGNTTSKIEDKIDKHIEDGPNILEELKYFRKELKKIHEKVDNNENNIMKFHKDIKIPPKNLEYGNSDSESFMHKIMMRFDKKFFDLDAINEAYLTDVFSKNIRIKNFKLQRKILLLIRNFINKHNSKIFQTGLANNFSVIPFEIQENKQNAMNIIDKIFKIDPINEVKRADLIMILIKEIKKKDPYTFAKIKKKCEKIHNIPNNFNFWIYLEKTEKTI